MKKLKLFLIVLLSFICIQAFPQLAVNSNLTANQLVYNVLIGNGVSASNVVFTGDPVAIGSFSGGGTTNLGLNEGILLTSGQADLAIGPNNGGSTGFDNNGGNDPQLAALVTTQIHDAATIEFDFIPLADTLRFRYVFGSDEYPEFSGSSYNDVFGFFISGPNPNGGQYQNENIAIIPGTTNTPVSINNINNGTTNTGPCTNCAFYVDNTNGIFLEYDALTTVMTATVVVTPCQTYHFKIAISDAGDGSYDSGVFLEANSFATDAVQINTNFSVPTAIQMGIEGCNYMQMEAILPDIQSTDFHVVMDSMWGTATNGVDFPFISDTLTIPAGQINGFLTITPFADGITEPIEDWNIIVQTSICTVDTIIFPILDYDTIVITDIASDTTICSDSAMLDVSVIGGHQPYLINWSPGLTLNDSTVLDPIAKPTAETNYVVTIMDSTGCPGPVDTINVKVFPKPQVSFMGNPFNGCEPLDVTFQDFTNPSATAWTWDFGDGNTSNQASPTHTYLAGTYDVSLTATTADGCTGSVTFAGLIQAYATPVASFIANPDVVSVDNPTIQFTDQSTNAVGWDWDFGDGNTSNIQHPSHTYNPASGIYSVWLYVTSDQGCRDSVYHETRVVVDEIRVFNIITPNGDGANDKFVIENIEFVEYSHLKIYNRWGKKVFDMENYQNNWDGENSPDGVYFYTLEYKTYFREDAIHGTVTVIRE